MSRGKLKAGELSLRSLEELYKEGDEALRGFVLKKAKEQGIKQEVFLERLGKTNSPLGTKIKQAQAYGLLEDILQSDAMKHVFDALPEFRITFDTTTKSYEMHQIRGKHDSKTRVE